MSTTSTTPILLGLDSAAEQVSLSRKSLERAIAAGSLATVRHGRRVLVDRLALVDWARRGSASRRPAAATPVPTANL